MSQESRYVVLCVDPVTNKVVFLNSEGKKASKAPTGALVRVTTDPAKLTNLVYKDKSTTVEVVPLEELSTQHWQGNYLTDHSVQPPARANQQVHLEKDS